MILNKVVHGDSIQEIKGIDTESIDLILSDIPYGIGFDTWDVLHSNNNSAYLGHSPSQDKSILFKSRGKPLNGWSEHDKQIPKEYYEWCLSWAVDWLRVLKPGASCFVFAGRRLAHRCICAFEDSGFIFKDMLSWEKDGAAHRAQNVSKVFERRKDLKNVDIWKGWKLGNLRPLFEPILWFMKPYKQGTTLTDNIKKYSLGAYNESFIKNFECENKGLEICSNIIKVKTTDDDRGLHPTQKPVSLMKYLIGLVTIEGQIVLDPFCGSGTTLVAAKEMNRSFIGIEQNFDFVCITKERLDNNKEV